MNYIGIIETISVLLGVLTPLILFLVIRSGIKRSHLSTEMKQRATWTSGLLILGWTLIIWISTLAGAFSYQGGDVFPKFLVALVVPLGITLFLFTRGTFKEIINHIPMSRLVGSQFWRIFGAVFFLVAIAGLGPNSLMGSGYGDVLTGSLSIIALIALINQYKGSQIFIWAFNIVGMIDLALILIILLGYYPLWSNAIPSSAGVGSYPLMLIAGLAAPVALKLHMLTIRKMVLKKV